MPLKLFTDPAVLRYVSRRLLVEFFSCFSHLLPKYSLPNPDSELYIETLAEVLQQPDQFPAPLIDALFTIEELAAPEKHPSVDPTSDDADSTRLTEAIRLWLHQPASELSPSVPDPAVIAPVVREPTQILHSSLCSLHSDALPLPLGEGRGEGPKVSERLPLLFYLAGRKELRNL